MNPFQVMTLGYFPSLEQIEVLRNRSFRNLWFAQVLTQIGLNMLVFVLGVIIYQKTRSNTHVSLLYLMVGLPAAIVGVASGVYVDRLNKRLILIASSLLRALLIVIILTQVNNFSLIYLLVACISVVSQFFIPAEAALIPQYVNERLLLSANSLFTMTFYSAIIGGFVLGGPLLDLVGEMWILAMLAVLFVLGGFLAYLLPYSGTIHTLKKLTFSQFWKDIFVAGKYIHTHTRIKDAILLLTMAQVVMTIFLILGPGFADKILTIRITDASYIILGPAALGMIIGALILGAIGSRLRKRSLINGGIFLSGFMLLSLYYFTRVINMPLSSSRFAEILRDHVFIFTIICFMLLGLANSMIDVSCNTVLQESTEKNLRGRIYGILSSLISGVSLLPVVVSAVLADMFGVGRIILIMGVTLLLFGIYTSNLWKMIRGTAY
ncbi:MFS transporter [Candidatus Gottesmanbacteria bacterium]|nr:MFS transporter [Candidatus Gottesmanbacteria bacterium]